MVGILTFALEILGAFTLQYWLYSSWGEKGEFLRGGERKRTFWKKREKKSEKEKEKKKALKKKKK